MAKQFIAQFCIALGVVFTLFVILVPNDLFLQKSAPLLPLHTQVQSGISQNTVVSDIEAEREHLDDYSGQGVTDSDNVALEDIVNDVEASPEDIVNDVEASAEDIVNDVEASPEDIVNDVEVIDKRSGHKDVAQLDDPVISTDEEVARENQPLPRDSNNDDEVPTEAVPEISESLDDFVHITMQVHGGITYNFDFSPSKASLDDLASDFCFKHGADFGVSPNNIRQGCVDPVVAYLRSQVPQTTEVTRQKTSTKIALTIDNKEVVFSIDLSDSGAHEISARSFCSQRGHEFGVTAETMNDCIAKIAQTLLMQIQQVPREEAVTAATV